MVFICGEDRNKVTELRRNCDEMKMRNHVLKRLGNENERNKLLIKIVRRIKYLTKPEATLKQRGRSR